MTVWFVHRRPDNAIASRHEEPVPGYAEEALEDEGEAASAELQAWVAQHLNPVPKLVSSGSLVRALYETDKYAAVDAAAEAAGGLVLALWRHAGQFERDHPLVAQIAAAVDLQPSELDDLFRSAGSYDQ